MFFLEGISTAAQQPAHCRSNSLFPKLFSLQAILARIRNYDDCQLMLSIPFSDLRSLFRQKRQVPTTTLDTKHIMQKAFIYARLTSAIPKLRRKHSHRTPIKKNMSAIIHSKGTLPRKTSRLFLKNILKFISFQ